jgi:hypothetical protein
MQIDDTTLENYRHDLAFLRATAEQVKKDCERNGFDLEIGVDNVVSLSHLQLQLEPYVKKWCKESSHRLAALLYQIDLPEHMLPERGACSNIPLLTSLILKRELIKVVLRKLYSS